PDVSDGVDRGCPPVVIPPVLHQARSVPLGAGGRGNAGQFHRAPEHQGSESAVPAVRASPGRHGATATPPATSSSISPVVRPALVSNALVSAPSAGAGPG